MIQVPCRIVALAALAASLGMQARAGVIGTASAGGYTFTNFDGPGGGPAGNTTVNGISNAGAVVGFTGNVTADFAGGNLNALTTLPLNAGGGDMANAINSAGTVVGGNGSNAFILPAGGSETALPMATGATTETALGINDGGRIVGQFTVGGTTPGFILDGTTFTRIDAPSGPDAVNAQGINNHGLVVGFFVGTDGQDHGFMYDSTAAHPAAVAIADPTIPVVPGEPAGTTFVFSQILGVNDSGLAVGYYGDSTGSQHGFLYNTLTGHYTFLDDPSVQFDGAVEVTQITGISNSGAIAGFYTDAAGIQHGFIANAVPEPASLVLLGLGGVAVVACVGRRGRGRAKATA